jgi:Helicase HerA, central domain
MAVLTRPTRLGHLPDADSPPGRCGVFSCIKHRQNNLALDNRFPSNHFRDTRRSRRRVTLNVWGPYVFLWEDRIGRSPRCIASPMADCYGGFGFGKSTTPSLASSECGYCSDSLASIESPASRRSWRRSSDAPTSMRTDRRALGPFELSREASGARRGLALLANALASASPGAGVLFEQVLGHPRLEFYVTDEAIVRSAEGALDPMRPPISKRSGTSLPMRESGWSRSIGMLVPSRGISERDVRLPRPSQWRGAGPSPPAIAASHLEVPGTRIRIAIQTFWISQLRAIWVARRWEVAVPREFPGRSTTVQSVAFLLAQDWSARLRCPVTSRELRFSRRAAREWDRGRLRNGRGSMGIELPVSNVPATATYGTLAHWTLRDAIREHLVVFGASGSGKTSALARLTCQAALDGRSVVVLDLHGDLSLAIANALPPHLRSRLVAVDVTVPRVAGVSVLGPGDLGGSNRVGAHLISALKRLTPDGSEMYWGFRLERIFDSFVQIVADEGGDLRDLLGLLTDPRRREASQLATHRPEIARFLAELPALERRNPEFLWSAVARIAKLSLSPSLLALVAPRENALPVDALLRRAGVIVFRIPFGSIGGEASSLVATLLLSRIYLGHTDPRNLGMNGSPLLLVLDEAHAIAPRLLAEILAEGRKFGVAAHLATQYPDRLAAEVRAAAAGAVRSHLLLCLAPIAAKSAGAWVGLTPTEAIATLPHLPPGRGILDHSSTLAEFQEVELGDPLSLDTTAWGLSVERTAERFGIMPIDTASPCAEDGLEPVLRALVAAPSILGSVTLGRISAYVAECSGVATDPSQILLRLQEAARRGLVRWDASGWQITPAGERLLGVGIRTGATRESAEHRILLNQAVRLLARRGLSLEILTQGRFDTTLPDGRVRLLDDRGFPSTPRELAERVHRLEGTWAWRFFGGRDVHVEAEVSGALRAERIRHGLRKASSHHAFALFLVSNDQRGNRVRAVLRSAGVFPHRAQVWVLRTPGSASSISGPPGNE